MGGMSYHLHLSSGLGVFPRDMNDVFLAESPLASPVRVIVQNAGLGEWLQRRLAMQCGGVMGLEVLMPEMALRDFADGYDSVRRLPGKDEGESGKGLLFMDGMKLAVFKAVEEAVDGDDEVFEPIRSYLGDERGGRLWQFSDALAGIFYHYGMNCLPLVETWERGDFFCGGVSDRLMRAERWQRALWGRIFRDEAPYTHLSRVLSEAMDSGESYDGPPCRVVLFGSMFLGETGLRFFRYLARDVEVYHFLFVPSRVFAPGSDGEARSAFLKMNGELSAGFARLAPELDLSGTEFVREDAGEPVRLLERVRQGLMNDSAPDGDAADDGSLVFHDVPGIRREVEILKDRILEALREDSSLAPTEIGVLAPNIGDYAPYIEEIFPASENEDGLGCLPYNLADLPPRTEAPYPAAFSLLTDLPGARFGRDSLFRLLLNPCFAGGVEEWKVLAESLHVRWGTDEGHRHAEGAADGRAGSWELAFSRLLAGYCLDERDRPEVAPFVVSGDGAADSAGDLIHAVRGLDGDFRRLDMERLSLRDWILRWEILMERWLQPRRDGEEAREDERDRLAVKGAVRDLMALCDDMANLSDFDDPELPWPAFRALLTEAAAKSSGRRGRYLARGVTCASLKPMRAIPFRRIYVLGMNEGAWPGQEYLTGFDLRDQVSKAIDLSRGSVDRFAVLETIFSASDHLAFFFRGREPERGERLSPASPLLELMDYLGPGAQQLVRHHPLVPYDRRALAGSGPLVTVSREAAALARARTGGIGAVKAGTVSGLVPPGGAGHPNAGDFSRPLVPEPGGEIVLEPGVLLEFLRNPVRYFFFRHLGLALPSEAEENGEEDVLEAAGLDWWKWRTDLISKDPGAFERGEVLAGDFMAGLDLEGAVARTPVRDMQLRRLKKEAEAAAGHFQEMRAEGLTDKEPFSILFGTSLSVSDRHGAVFPAPGAMLAGGTELRIMGRVGGLRHSGTEEGVWTLVDFVAGSRVRAYHNLKGWLTALLVLCLPDEERPAGLRVFRLGPAGIESRLYLHGPGEGSRIADPQAVLAGLGRAYDAGRIRPLPLYPEMAEALAAAAGKGHLEGRFSEEALSLWNRTLANRYDPHSRLLQCGYRREFLECPVFDDAFELAWKELYVEGGLL